MLTLFESEPTMRTQDVRNEVSKALAGTQFSLLSPIYNDKRKNYRRFKLFIKKLNEEITIADANEILKLINNNKYKLYYVGLPFCCSYSNVACLIRKAAV